MSGDITISGGSTEVTSDALLVAHTALRSLSGTLDELVHELRPALALGADLVPGITLVSIAVQDAARLAQIAATGIRAAAARSRRLADGLLEAAGRYDDADRNADARMADLSTVAGWAFGRLAPLAAFAAILALPELLATFGIAFSIGSLVAGSPQAFLKNLGTNLGDVAGSKARLLRDPRAVSLIRFAVSAADDAMLGAAGLPLPFAALADDRGTRTFGLRGGGSVVVGSGHAIGAFKETAVSVERTSTGTVAPPAGFADLAARIPPSRAGSPQIRVERYAGAGGEPAYIVYVGGTVDTGPVAGGEPFDMTSNLNGVAQLDPASLRATQQAMREAGIRPGDTVIPVGYSQGGIVATSVAMAGDYDIPALVTFGSPTAGVDVPSSTVDVAVEHSDDLVPALGGIPLAADRGGGDRIVVTRQTYSGGVPPGSSPIDAHLMNEYAITAHEMDAAQDSRLAAALATLPIGGPGGAELFRGIRTSPRPAAGGGGGGNAW
ncbi:hypothetical protein GCM10028798_03820 [Humibacter antri]